MAPPITPWPLSLSRRLYRALLRAYPSSFHRNHGEAMAQLFWDCCRDAYRERGSVGLLAVWRHTFGDLCVSALRERRAALLKTGGAMAGWDLSSTPWAAPTPALGALLRVLPVGQTQHREPWSLTLVMVEHWGGACIASFTLRWRAPAGAVLPPMPTIGLALRATDGRGGRYHACQCGGSGGSEGGTGHMDLAYTFTPALDPAARVLRIEARVQLLVREGSPPRLVLLRNEPEVWAFTVAAPLLVSIAQ